MARGSALWWRWIIATSIGEMLGMTASALFGAAIGVPASIEGGPLVSELMLLAAGLIEGALLGGTQSVALRGLLKRARDRALWITATSVGMGLGWLGATHLSGAVSNDTISIDISTLLFQAAGVGFTLGAIVGLGQAWVLSRVTQARSWIVITALAWVVGLCVSFLGNSQLPSEAWSPTLFGIVAATGAATGAVVGAITSLGFVLLAVAEFSRR